MELLVVIAIIGILSAIVIPNLNNARAKGRDARRISDLKSIQLALTTYYDTHRADGYPLDVDSLYGDPDETISPTYLSVMPKDPKSGKMYGYVSDGDEFCLGALLENTSQQTTDDSADCTLGDDPEDRWDDGINYKVTN